MSGVTSLTGQCILVVEDDYHLATEAALTLEDAGADVVGPCATEQDARDAADGERLSGAVLDINLRGSRSFGLARELKARGVPFIFMTGYDREVIPQEFDAVIRLEKPVDGKCMVEAVGKSIRRAPDTTAQRYFPDSSVSNEEVVSGFCTIGKPMSEGGSVAAS